MNNGPVDCLVTEMLQCLPMETVYEGSHWFDRRFKEECQAPEAWKVLRLAFLKKPDAKPEKDFMASVQSLFFACAVVRSWCQTW